MGHYIAELMGAKTKFYEQVLVLKQPTIKIYRGFHGIGKAPPLLFTFLLTTRQLLEHNK